MTNCTFVGNRAIGLRGGGIFNDAGAGARLANCVLWNNRDVEGVDETAQIHPADGSSLVNYTCVEGLDEFNSLGTGNIGDDPLFVDATDDDFRLASGSPCIDAADNSAVPSDLTDLDDDSDLSEVVPFDLNDGTRFLDDPTNDPDSGTGTCT